jgi:hypothetical protein
MNSSSRGDFSKFTFRLDEKDYKGAIPEHFSNAEFGGTTTKRFIGVKFIPKGTMMFHSYRQDEPLTGETLEQTANRNLANFLQRYCLNTCEYEKNTDSFKICFTTEGNKSKFFFPGPCAGFGLMYAENYNTTMLCLTKRDMYVAYLKSGYYPDDSLILHRKIPLTSGDLINYDGDRVVSCDRLNSPYTCMTTDNTDPCLKKKYILEGKVDGYTTVSIPDSILSIKDNGTLAANYKKKDLILFTFLQNLLKRVADEGDAEKKQLLLNLYNSLLLLLETDTKIGFVSAGISEYAFQPFGHMSSDPNYLPMLTQNAKGLFEVLEEQKNGETLKMVVRVKRENMEKFIKDYVEPYSILQPLKLFTTYGNLDINQNKNNGGVWNTLTNFLGNYAPLTEDQKYKISYDIAQYMFKDLGGFLWEPRSNVFVLAQAPFSNRTEKISLKFVLRDTKSVKPVPIGFNDYKISEDVGTNVYAYFYKIINLLITNRFWNLENHSKGQIDVFKISLPGSQEFMSVLDGPFFQPLNTKQVLKFDRALEVFASIHSFLERGTGVASEYSKLIKKNYSFFKNISDYIVDRTNTKKNYATIGQSLSGGFRKKLNMRRTRKKNRLQGKIQHKSRRKTMKGGSILEEEEKGGHSSTNIVLHSKKSLKGMSNMLSLPAAKSLFAKIPSGANQQNPERPYNTSLYSMYTSEK